MGQVGCCAEYLKRVARGLEFKPGCVVIAQLTAGQSDQDARAGHFVRRVELDPRGPRGAERAERALRLTGGEQHGSGRVRGGRLQEGCVELGGESGQLGRRGARGVAIARGQHDLDARAERAGASAAIGGFLEDASDRRTRGVDLALRQPQQGRARLRPPRPRAGLLKRLVGAGEVAPQPVQLRQLVEGRPPRRARRSSLARRASSMASGHAPCRRKISARRTMHSPRNATRSGWSAHQRVSAAVHSRARRQS